MFHVIVKIFKKYFGVQISRYIVLLSDRENNAVLLWPLVFVRKLVKISIDFIVWLFISIIVVFEFWFLVITIGCRGCVIVETS